MGYALAYAALEARHEVTLITGPAAIAPPAGARVVRITTSDELHDAVHEHVRDCDIIVMCAAVSDYRPLHSSAQKLDKQRGEFSLQLKPTRDILASLSNDRRYFVVGFAAETHDLAASAQQKLIAKNCDVIVANDVSKSDSGMESDENEVTIFSRIDEPQHITRAQKKIIARENLKIVFALREKSLTKKT